MKVQILIVNQIFFYDDDDNLWMKKKNIIKKNTGLLDACKELNWSRSKRRES
jgi:hypothetical protein